MAIINPNLNISEIRETFLKTGSVFIRDFLVPEYAEVLDRFFNRDMPSDWWYSASTTVAGVEYDRNYNSNREMILQKRKEANQRAIEGHFSYSFFRTLNNHADSCYCDECNLRKVLISEEILLFLSSIDDGEFDRASEIFASKFESGCFLSTHNDLKN